MIVLGDISGIQRYIFDVSESGGGQARRLRSRSFLVQTLAECAALRVLERMNWQTLTQHYLFSGAGKFILRGAGKSSEIQALAIEMNDQLLRDTQGELRLSLAVGEGETEVASYREAQEELQRVKSAPWQPTNRWDPQSLVLAPLDTPCALCRRAAASQEEPIPDSAEFRRVCRSCAQSFELGRSLPRARWLSLTTGSGGQFSWLDFSGKLAEKVTTLNNDSHSYLVSLDSGTLPENRASSRFISRRLNASIPQRDNGEPIWFTELVKQAKGDRLLAVLKADVDSLGVHIEQRLQGQNDLTAFLQFANSLDSFFAAELRREIEQQPNWKSIYTVFAGGDDLVMIGPWDVMFRFAGHMRELFRLRFPKLTLSAGLALFKPTRPVRNAIEQADTLLTQAKLSPKDQLAAFGQVWNWQHQAMILRQGEQLAAWVQQNQIQRGWLHTLLELVLDRHGDKPAPLATSRLAYHVNRNYRKSTDAYRWASNIIQRFDDVTDAEVNYLPSIVRYALTATRTPNEKE